jgi:ligand-binding sensor domain-containing protein
MVWQIDIAPSQQMWIKLGDGEVGYFDGGNWVLFSREDYAFSDKPSDMSIAPDGSVWISNSHVISRHQDGNWDVFPIPNVNDPAATRLAISPSGEVWVATPLCSCDNSIKKFDGIQWQELFITDKHFRASQLLFTADGTLWAALGLPVGIGQYDGKSWNIYSGADLWPTGYPFANRIASDNRGNIYSIYERQKWLIRISNDGDITTIPFDNQNLSLNTIILRLFIDSQGTIWLNAGLNNGNALGVAYYRDDQWVSFTDLPFSFVTDINELADGTILIATEKGLFQFRSARQIP